jgi:hypothetical protein
MAAVGTVGDMTTVAKGEAEATTTGVTIAVVAGVTTTETTAVKAGGMTGGIHMATMVVTAAEGVATTTDTTSGTGKKGTFV